MRIILKIIGFLVLLLCLNILFEKTEYQRFVWNEADQLFQVKKAENCPIVYTSASSNFSPGSSENNRKKISQILDSLIPNQQVEAFNIPASHAKIHTDLLALIPSESKVQSIVATMNLRSFGADWRHSELESALNKSDVMYNDRPALLNRFLISLNAYDNKTNLERELQKLEEWEDKVLPFQEPRNTVKNWCAQEKWGDWTNPKRLLTDQYIKQYAFVLSEENARVRQFDAMADLCKERSWRLIFHILPENIETADSLAGSDLSKLMLQNAAWLQTRYSAKGATVVNNINLLGAESFFDKDFPTEHYYYVGRKAIAERIAEVL